MGVYPISNFGEFCCFRFFLHFFCFYPQFLLNNSWLEKFLILAPFIPETNIFDGAHRRALTGGTAGGRVGEGGEGFGVAMRPRHRRQAMGGDQRAGVQPLIRRARRLGRATG